MHSTLERCGLACNAGMAGPPAPVKSKTSWVFQFGHASLLLAPAERNQLAEFFKSGREISDCLRGFRMKLQAGVLPQQAATFVEELAWDVACVLLSKGSSKGVICGLSALKQDLQAHQEEIRHLRSALAEARHSYLRELSFLRDQVRSVDDNTLGALQARMSQDWLHTYKHDAACGCHRALIVDAVEERIKQWMHYSKYSAPDQGVPEAPAALGSAPAEQVPSQSHIAPGRKIPSNADDLKKIENLEKLLQQRDAQISDLEVQQEKSIDSATVATLQDQKEALQEMQDMLSERNAKIEKLEKNLTETKAASQADAKSREAETSRTVDKVSALEAKLSEAQKKMSLSEGVIQEQQERMVQLEERSNTIMAAVSPELRKQLESGKKISAAEVQQLVKSSVEAELSASNTHSRNDDEANQKISALQQDLEAKQQQYQGLQEEKEREGSALREELALERGIKERLQSELESLRLVYIKQQENMKVVQENLKVAQESSKSPDESTMKTESNRPLSAVVESKRKSVQRLSKAETPPDLAPPNSSTRNSTTSESLLQISSYLTPPDVTETTGKRHSQRNSLIPASQLATDSMSVTLQSHESVIAKRPSVSSSQMEDEVPTWGHGGLSRPSSAPSLQQGGRLRRSTVASSGTILGTLYNEGGGHNVLTLDAVDERDLIRSRKSRRASGVPLLSRSSLMNQRRRSNINGSPEATF